MTEEDCPQDCPKDEKCERIMARQMEDGSWKCIRSGCGLIWKD